MATSPVWKKPADVMKRRLVRRRTASATSCSLLTAPTHASGQAQQENAKCSTATKRKNPFASVSGQAAKRQRDSGSGESLRSSRDPLNTSLPVRASSGDLSDNAAALFTALGKTKESAPNKSSHAVLSEVENQIPNMTDHSKVKPQHAMSERSMPKTEESVEKERKFLSAYPVDWSLKTRVRYTSAKSFSWCAPLKSHEESAGLMQHMKQTPAHSGTQMMGDSVEAKSDLARRCVLWTHPHIPWLKTFPRHVNDTRIGKPSAVFHSEDMQKALLNDWTRSLSSLFDLLRSGHCPYFYLCSHICHVLFRGASNGVDMHALVTPTTRGFRQSLQEEGVEFEMPLHKSTKGPESNADEATEDTSEKCSPSEKSTRASENQSKGVPENDNSNETPEDNEVFKPVQSKGGVAEGDDVTDDVDDDITGTDAGASSWLATLGIDRSKYRSLDPNKVKIQRDVFKQIDNRPESAIHVQGSNCVALFNFLLNCRSLVNNTGELAGVPPSLIAPVPFKSATLTSLNVKQGTIRQQTAGGGIEEAYSVELSGPILPDTLHHVNQLFRKTQGAFTASCSVHETTTPFNLSVDNKIRTVAEYMKDNEEDSRHCAVPVSINDRNNGRQAIREFYCENNLYSWS